MAFIFKNPKHICKTGSRDGQEVLNRLNAYLDGHVNEPVKFLMSFWKDQETVFTYKDIRQAILDGSISLDIMRAWQQDYSKLLADKMYPVWMDAIKAGVTGQPIFDGLPEGFTLNTKVPNVISWIESRGSAFVTSVTDEQRKAINALLVKRITDKYTADELARVIRPCIGLTEGQVKANFRYYNSIKETLAKDHPRMRKESIERKAREKQLLYAAKQHRQRAYTIAHTEMAFAFNKGMDATIRQAQAEGLMGIMEKKWVTAGTDSYAKVCDTCKALDGMSVGMDEEFDFKGKKLFPGQKLTPPAHPRCRCAVQYIEVEPPNLGIGISEIPLSATPTSSFENENGKDIRHDPPKYLGSLDNMSRNVVLSTLRKYEREIVGYAKESAIVITAAGLVFQCFGDKENVYINEDMGDDLRGAYVTHNHPSGSSNEYSFSKSDIALFLEYNLEILRGIDEEFIYELTRNPEELDDHLSISELNEHNSRHDEVISRAEQFGIGYRRYSHE